MLESPVIQKLEEHTMKKSIIARVGIMAVALTVATTSLMSGTLAKYTTSGTGTAEAIVATWGADRMTINGTSVLNKTAMIFLTDASQIDATTVDPALKDTNNKVAVDTIKVNNSDGSINNTDTSTGVTTCYKLAPGMNGEIPIVIDMKNAEIDTDYIINIEGTKNCGAIPSHLVYTLDDDTTEHDLNDVLDPGGLDVAKGTIKSKARAQAAGETQAKTVKFKWKWPYQSSNTGTSDSDKAARKAWDDQDNTDLETIKTDNFKPIQLKITITAQQADYTTHTAG